MRIFSLLPRTVTALSLLMFLASSMLITRDADAQTSVNIHDIMVASPGTSTYSEYFLPNSDYLYSHYGSTVSVSGIVVGVMTTGDFAGTVYISNPSSGWDNYQATAEGMPVFSVASLNPACAVVGNTITVVGEVVESNSLVSADITAADTPGTGVLPSSCAVNSTGGTMTQSISLNSTLTSFGGALEYTGMTTSATFYAVSPTSGTLTESTETTTSTGQFWATITSNTATNNHLFRSTGIAGDEYVPSTAPSTVATWAGNPQRILIDTTTFGGNPVNISVGQTITCATGSNITVGATSGIGLIDYTLGYARLLIFPTSVCTVGGTVAATTSATADSTHFHVGTLDLNRFYNTTSNTSGAVVISATAYATRLAKAANAIVNSLGSPDILCVQEVKDLDTLTDLASAVNNLGSTSYVSYLTEGNDTSSLNLGFLVKSTTVTVDSVTQIGKSSTYTTASSGSAALWERPPLVLAAEFVRTGKNYPVDVINVHLTPRDNIGDTTLGANVRLHRADQAAALSTLVQSYQTAGGNVVVAGNFNSFEYNDGYVDVLGIVDGSPAAATAVTLYQATNTTAALTDFTTSISEYERYNYIDRGNAESLEHILASATVTDSSIASASLASYETSVTQPHFSTDFAAIDANSSTTAAGLTPHDGQVVAFLIPPVPTTASISSSAINFGSVYLGNSASRTITITNTTTFTSTVTISSVAISGTNATDFSQTSTCTSLFEGSTCTVTVTFTPTAAGTRTALLTVTTDSTSNPTLIATLTGTGVSAISASSSTLAFGNIDLGSSSAAQVLTITNNTATAATISGIIITGDFSETTTCGTSLAAKSTCTISVIFTPTVLGARTGTLSILNGTATVVAVALTGNGVDFSISVAPTSGQVIAGYALSPIPTLTLTPLGGFSAPITITCTTTATGSACTPSSTTLTLSATTTVPVTISTTSQYTVVGYTGFSITSRPWVTLLLFLATGSLWWNFRRRAPLPRLTSMFTLLLLLSFANLGCGSKIPDKNSNPTYPGTYTYTFSVTDGTLIHTATYSLTVTAK